MEDLFAALRSFDKSLGTRSATALAITDSGASRQIARDHSDINESMTRYIGDAAARGAIAHRDARRNWAKPRVGIVGPIRTAALVSVRAGAGSCVVTTHAI